MCKIELILNRPALDNQIWDKLINLLITFTVIAIRSTVYTPLNLKKYVLICFIRMVVLKNQGGSTAIDIRAKDVYILPHSRKLLSLRILSKITFMAFSGFISRNVKILLFIIMPIFFNLQKRNIQIPPDFLQLNLIRNWLFLQSIKKEKIRFLHIYRPLLRQIQFTNKVLNITSTCVLHFLDIGNNKEGHINHYNHRKDASNGRFLIELIIFIKKLHRMPKQVFLL